MDERQQLEQAIAVQESLRGTLDDAIIDATTAALKEKLAALVSAEQHQRKLATILFMDIVESTTLTSNLDPEEQMSIIDPVLSRMAAKITEHGGHISRFQGDGFKAVFGLPMARENDPEQAIRAGLAIQSEAALIAEELEKEHGLTNFQVRVGITTGLIFSGGLTEGEDTVKGQTVNLAARLESAAHPGTVLISYECFKHVRGIFDFEPLEPIQAKGFAEPIQVYRVLRAKERPFYRGMRGVEGVETQMVGREIEFKQLQNSLMDVVDLGEMQMLTVVGEAGLGKSRMLYEFENWVDLLPERVWLYKGRARLETQGIPYGLLRDLFANRFDIRDNDSAQTVRDKLIAGFGAAFDGDASSEKKVHFLGHLLGYDFPDSLHLADFLEHPNQLREQAFYYLSEFFQLLTEGSPVMVLLEDMHWADEASLDAINQLSVNLLTQPVFILATARHTLLERRPHWGEGQNFHQLIFFRPLSKRESRRLIAEVLQRVEDVPESLIELVVSNAEGNPFYIEELIKMLVEDGVIVRENPHWRVEAGRLEQVHVPSTLTGVLQARLDGLPPEERKILQSASVIGRVFWDQILDYINGSLEETITDKKIIDVLDDLRSKELVFRRETSTFAEAREHIFKHALLRDVTYESVLLRVRQAYHALVADWLIEHAGGRVGEFTGMIADHLELAGRNTQACQYLLEAGKQAAGKFANEEAIRYFTRALTLTSKTDLEGRYEILLEREKIYDLIGSREVQEADINALKTLAEEIGVGAKQAEALLQEARFAELTGDYARSLEAAKSAVIYARDSDNLELEGGGQLAWGRALWRQGELDQAKDRGTKALELARKADAQQLVGDTLRLMGILMEKDDFEASIRNHQEILTIYQNLGDRIGESLALNNLAILYDNHFDLDQALAFYQEGLAICQQIGFKELEGLLLANSGNLYYRLGLYPKGLENYKHALEIYRQVRSPSGIAQALWNLGSIYFIEKNYEKVNTYADEGLPAARLLGNLDLEGGFLWLLFQLHIGLENWKEIDRLQKTIEDLMQKTGWQPRKKYVWEAWAKLYIKKGMPRQAVEQVDLILEDQESNGIENDVPGVEFYPLYTCCQVLLACDDPRAGQVIETAYSLVQEYAAKIQNVEFRESFLNNVPWNRGIIELWEAGDRERRS